MSIPGKLRSRKGETLTETLIAVLIVGLASVVLASMVTAASRMSAQAEERDDKLYAAVTAAEAQPDSAKVEESDSSPTVQVTVGDNSTVNFSVTYFSDEDGTLSSYRYEKGASS